MAKRAGPDDLADIPADVAISSPELLARSFLDFERYDITLHSGDGKPVRYRRDLLRVGPVVGVLAYDPATDEVILIRQFRTGAHLASGRGEMIEIVAGLVDPGEDTAAAAARECAEEIGVPPRQVIELFEFMPAPGFTDEHATLYLAVVDAGAVPDRAGLLEELEQIVPLRVSVDDALAALNRGSMINGYVLHALHWLALNRGRLPEIVARGSAKAV